MTFDLMRQIEDKLNRGEYSGEVDKEITFLRDEVFRLRALPQSLLPHSLPLDEIRLLIQCADHGAPSVEQASETVSAWLVELVGDHRG